MKVTIVYGTDRKGCTYHIAQEVLEELTPQEVNEIILPKDLPDYCISCMRCFTEEKGICAHSRYTTPIREKLLSAELIILTSPVYSYHVSGQMKVFLDHYANMWMVHRPEKAMFHKQGLVIATASGPVFKKTLNEMKDSLDFWGVAKTYKIGTALFQAEWDKVPQKTKARVLKKAKNTARSILNNNGKATPSFRVRKWFYISRMMQKYSKLNPPDAKYWEEQGWTGIERPWHK